MRKKRSLPKLSEINAEFLEEWDYIKNIESIENLSVGSNKKVWWVCKSCQSSWDDTVTHRYKESRGCPYCRGFRVNDTNSLYSINPSLSSEFDIEKNQISPKEVYAHSGKSYWWKCFRCI
mgnify:CR=1 FL=1